MPPLIGIILARYWRPLLLGIGLVGIVAYRAVLIGERDHARSALADAKTLNAALTARNDELAGAIERDNAAVAALRRSLGEQARAQSAREQAASREAAASARRAEAVARALGRAPVAPGCEAAIRWGNEQAKELSQW